MTRDFFAFIDLPACFPLLLADSIDSIMQRRRQELASGYTQAEQEFKAALKDTQKRKDRMREFLAFEALAQISERHNDPSTAAQYFLKALQSRKGVRGETAQFPALIDLEQFYHTKNSGRMRPISYSA